MDRSDAHYRIKCLNILYDLEYFDVYVQDSNVAYYSVAFKSTKNFQT